MPKKLNCWEFYRCRREKGNNPCPAATSSEADGINGGSMGGRVCWAIAGTFCGDRVQGLMADKMCSCLACRFFLLVRDEEGLSFQLLLPGQRYSPPKRD